jgi:2'-hydroxyisoflavone reductase
MRLLILGGTVFLGRHLVEAALAKGHHVTLFNRGRSGEPPSAAALERVVGDRNVEDDLARLAAGKWDAVVDTCAYYPRQIEMAAAALAGRVGRYLVVSSISAYAEAFGASSAQGDSEDAPLAEWPAGLPFEEKITGETYGPLKAACERATLAAFGDRAIVVRPGLIVGPNDPSDRYTYWITRAVRGGEAVAPGDGARLVQYVDVRDLAEFMLRLVEAPSAAKNVYTVTGKPERFDAFLAAVSAATGSSATWRWIPEVELLAQRVGPWMDLPLWIDGRDQRLGIDRALAAGLRLRPGVETARATYEWDRLRPPDAPRKAGLTPEREAEVLARRG